MEAKNVLLFLQESDGGVSSRPSFGQSSTVSRRAQRRPILTVRAMERKIVPLF